MLVPVVAVPEVPVVPDDEGQQAVSACCAAARQAAGTETLPQALLTFGQAAAIQAMSVGEHVLAFVIAVWQAGGTVTPLHAVTAFCIAGMHAFGEEDASNKHPFLPFPAPRPSAHDEKRVTVAAGLLFVPEDETSVHALSETT